MKRQLKTSFIFLLIVSSFSVFSQADRPLVHFKDLVFKNDSEKNAFAQFDIAGNKVSPFDLLFASYDDLKIGDKAAALNRVDACVASLKKATSDKSEAKKVKIVYEYVHKEFLKVYKLKNSFIDIFETGEYNCVSASALYAIVFSKLDIPYQIKETPTHVYLIAYPNSSKVLIETTSPAKGYYQFSNSFITKYVTNLYNSKIITKEEFETVSVNDLFNKHYFTSDNISIHDLAGLQYSNFAIYFMDDSELQKAKEHIKKAYFLFKSDRHRYLLKATLLALIDKNGYEKFDNVLNLEMLCRFNNLKDKELSNDVIGYQFEELLNTQLIKNSDYDLFDKSYEKISSEIQDSSLKGDITYGYHYELARLGYLSSKNQEYLLKHLSAAYAYNPLNANLRALIIGAYERAVQNFNDSKSIMDGSEIYVKTFDFFEENEFYISVKLNCILDLAYRSYYYSDMVKGDGYIKDFETLIKKNEGVTATANFVEKAYSQGATEYYKRGNYGKSKQLLKSGLIYAPNSFGLQQRLKQFD